MPAGFRCEVIEHDGRPTMIRVLGELDLATAPEFSAHVSRCAGPLVFDLGETSFIDSTGLRALLTASDGDGRPVVLCPPGAPRRILEITGVDQVFDLYDDAESWQAQTQR